MIKVNSKVYSLISTLFLFLVILGYQLATSLFLPIQSDVEALSHKVSYPYRAIIFVLAVILIVTKPKNDFFVRKSNLLWLFVGFMIVYYFRILIDIYVRNVYVLPAYRTTIIQFMFLSVIPSSWAILHCGKCVNINLLNKMLLWGGIALLVIFFFSQNAVMAVEYDESQRVDANVGLGSIGYGNVCVSIAIICFVWMRNMQMKKIYKLLLLTLIFVSIVIMLRAASRGPLISLIIVFLFIFSTRGRNGIWSVFLIGVFALFIVSTIDHVLQVIGSVSPIMQERLSALIYEDDSSGRDVIYSNAIDIFLNNPFLGGKFVADRGSYSHNMILDVLIGLGIMGGIILIYIIFKDIKITYMHLKRHSPIVILGLLSVQYIMSDMFSGAMYIDTKLIVTMLMLFQVQSTVSEYQ